MAGVLGFEPRNAGIKTLCLTTWRHPKISEKLYNKSKLNIRLDNCPLFSRELMMMSIGNPLFYAHAALKDSMGPLLIGKLWPATVNQYPTRSPKSLLKLNSIEGITDNSSR